MDLTVSVDSASYTAAPVPAHPRASDDPLNPVARSYFTLTVAVSLTNRGTSTVYLDGLCDYPTGDVVAFPVLRRTQDVSTTVNYRRGIAPTGSSGAILGECSLLVGMMPDYVPTRTALAPGATRSWTLPLVTISDLSVSEAATAEGRYAVFIAVHRNAKGFRSDSSDIASREMTTSAPFMVRLP